jgi:hypothetical protein
MWRQIGTVKEEGCNKHSPERAHEERLQRPAQHDTPSREEDNDDGMAQRPNNGVPLPTLTVPNPLR